MDRFFVMVKKSDGRWYRAYVPDDENEEIQYELATAPYFWEDEERENKNNKKTKVDGNFITIKVDKK